MKVKSESEVAQSRPPCSDPMDCSLPGSSVHGTFQARVLEWGAIAFSKILEECKSVPNFRAYFKAKILLTITTCQRAWKVLLPLNHEDNCHAKGQLRWHLVLVLC